MDEGAAVLKPGMDVDIAGDTAKKYASINFAGIEFVGSNLIVATKHREPQARRVKPQLSFVA